MFRIKEVCPRDASEKPCTLADAQPPSRGALLSGHIHTGVQLGEREVRDGFQREGVPCCRCNSGKWAALMRARSDGGVFG